MKEELLTAIEDVNGMFSTIGSTTVSAIFKSVILN
jgi:hypothetical protein